MLVPVSAAVAVARTSTLVIPQMFAKNVATFLALLIKDGQWNLDLEDEIIRETLVTRDGRIVHAKVGQTA